MDNWRELPLEDCMEEIIDYRGKTPDKSDKGVLLITAKIVKDGRINYDSKQEYISEGEYTKRMTRGIPKKGDVVITTEAPLGEVAQLDGRKVAIGQRIITLRGKPELLDNTFLKYLLQSKKVQAKIREKETGTTVTGIKQKELRRIILPIPPLSTQNQIANILGSLDDKIELNLQMNQALESMARAIFKSWFVDFDPVYAKMEGRDYPLPPEIMDLFPNELEESELGLIPKGWRVSSLDQIANYLNGLALQKYPPENEKESLPVIKIRELRSGFPDNQSNLATTDLPNEYVIDDGDIIFSWSGSLLVKIWCGGKGALNQHLFKVTSEKYPKWFYYLWTDYHLSEFQRIAADKATTMGHIKRRHLQDAKVIIPKADLLVKGTKYIAPFIEKFISNSIIEKLLNEEKELLLPKLLSGDIEL